MSYLVDHKGYHYRKKKSRDRKPPYLTPHQRLFSFLLTSCSLLLISSVHVASQAMQPRLVELWKCRVQHLRQFYSTQKHKQKGTARPSVYSSQFRYFPILLMLWLIVAGSTGSTVLLADNMDTVMSTIGKTMHSCVCAVCVGGGRKNLWWGRGKRNNRSWPWFMHDSIQACSLFNPLFGGSTEQITDSLMHWLCTSVYKCTESWLLWLHTNLS